MQKVCTTAEMIACFEDTKRMYETDAELVAVTEEAKRKTVLFYEKPTAERFPGNGRAAQISVTEDTTFHAAFPLAESRKTVAVLNFASPVTPGGGVRDGAMAQEESLCRSSNLFACLNQPLLWENYYNYHRAHNDGLYSDRLIYSKGITVFKSDDEVPRLLPREQWRQVDVITCAMPNLRGGTQYATDFLLSLYKRRIRAVLHAAIFTGAKYLVLGAIGCGAFCNDPDFMAEAFRAVLADGNYATAFEQIVFAVKPAADKRNLTAFQQAFKTFSRSVSDANARPSTPKIFGIEALKDLVFGRYLIQRRLKGIEGNASYQVLDTQTNTPCFLEVADHEAKNGDALVQLLLSEARHRQRLCAYAVPEVLDIGEKDSIIYVASEWIEGENLLALLHKKGRLSQDRVVNVAMQLCDALYAMETMVPPIVHRSIIPANLLLKPNGQVYLLDFSVACEYVYGVAAEENPLGVHGYAAPEQFSSTQRPDPRADIYGLGMTMYTLLTGIEAQNAKQGYLPLRQYNPGFSKKLEPILLKCIHPDPQFRYQNAAELKADLRKV